MKGLGKGRGRGTGGKPGVRPGILPFGRPRPGGRIPGQKGARGGSWGRRASLPVRFGSPGQFRARKGKGTFFLPGRGPGGKGGRSHRALGAGGARFPQFFSRAGPEEGPQDPGWVESRGTPGSRAPERNFPSGGIPWGAARSGPGAVGQGVSGPGPGGAPFPAGPPVGPGNGTRGAGAMGRKGTRVPRAVPAGGGSPLEPRRRLSQGRASAPPVLGAHSKGGAPPFGGGTNGPPQKGPGEPRGAATRAPTGQRYNAAKTRFPAPTKMVPGGPHYRGRNSGPLPRRDRRRHPQRRRSTQGLRAQSARSKRDSLPHARESK